jgi:hypothetical protein
MDLLRRVGGDLGNNRRAITIVKIRAFDHAMVAIGNTHIQVCAHWNTHNIGTDHATTEPAIRSIAREESVEVCSCGSFR